MPETELLGLIAGTLTTLAFLPQVIKTFKSRSAKDISRDVSSLQRRCGPLAGLWHSARRSPDHCGQCSHADPFSGHTRNEVLVWSTRRPIIKKGLASGLLELFCFVPKGIEGGEIFLIQAGS